MQQSDLITLTRRPTVIDLYAGAGGLSLGLEQAGFDVLAAAEFDPIHALTHKFNLPDTPVLCRDLGEAPVLDVADALRAVIFTVLGERDLDAVVGGPPCQGFSVGGVRDMEDERNSQFLRFVDLVVELQPKVFLLENVAGLLEPRFDSLRKEAVRRFAVEGGYEVGGFESSVSAVDYGVPQRRRRVLIMGSRVGAVPQLPRVIDENDHVTVGDALAGLPSIARYSALLASDETPLAPDDLARLRAAGSSYARILAGQSTSAGDLSRPRLHNDAILTNSLRTVHKPKSVQRFRKTPPGSVERVSRLFRLDPESQARTLRAGTGTDRGSHTSPRPIHPEKDRVITVREAARIHGFPDWFRFHATNWHGHRQVGNSVPPPLAAAAGQALLSALGARGLARPTDVVKLGDPDWLWMSRVEAVAELNRLDAITSSAARKRMPRSPKPVCGVP